jgi:hypothetical protein
VGIIPVNGGMLVGVPPTHNATRDDLGMMKQLGLPPAIARPELK